MGRVGITYPIESSGGKVYYKIRLIRGQRRPGRKPVPGGGMTMPGSPPVICSGGMPPDGGTTGRSITGRLSGRGTGSPPSEGRLLPEGLLTTGGTGRYAGR